jgi:hypothetical protein
MDKKQLIDMPVDKQMNKEQLIDMPVDKQMNKEQLIDMPDDKQMNKEQLIDMPDDKRRNKKQLIDMPVDKKADDSLDVGMYANILSDFIRACETPITIGIQGDWGIGKTSLLYMVRENLLPKKGRAEKYHVIYFNTWQYSQFNQEGYLGLSILKGIMTEIQKLKPFIKGNEQLKESVSNFGNFLGNLGKQLAKSHGGVDVDKLVDSYTGKESSPIEKDMVAILSELKTEFSRLVNSLTVANGQDDKLVIMIDDLDRIKPIKALEFLEAIKNFLDVENCVFVMAVDYSVIQTGMIEKLGRSAQELKGKSYFDKIIQVPFNMPIDSYNTNRYVMSLLGWDRDKENGEYHQRKDRDDKDFFLKIKISEKRIEERDVEFFSSITRLTVGNNPRGIKRAINYANLLKMIVREKRSKRKDSDESKGERWKLDDAKILYSLTCFQLAWPELFSHFAESPSPETIQRYQELKYLNDINGMDSVFKRTHNPDELKSQITRFFDEFMSLVDTNGNDEIDAEEFEPILAMMNYANLTNARLSNFKEDMEKLMEMAKPHCEEKDRPVLEEALKLFSESNWKNPTHLKLLEAGKRVFNILWDKKEVGSLVLTKKDGIQLYLKTPANGLKSGLLGDASRYITDVNDKPHWGSGDTKIDLYAMSESDKGIDIMNTIHENFLKQPRAGMAQPQDISGQT